MSELLEGAMICPICFYEMDREEELFFFKWVCNNCGHEIENEKAPTEEDENDIIPEI